MLIATQIQKMVELLEKASEMALIGYNNSYNVNYKKDFSPVTDIDKKISEMLVEGIGQITPDFSIISEEGGNVLKQGDEFWLIDPIDGTKPFINKEGNFTINAGLIKNGKAEFGIISEPLLGEIYFTDESNHVMCSQGAVYEKTSLARLKDEKGINVVVSQNFSFANEMVVPLEEILDNIPVSSKKCVSSSYKFCMIACGKADLYFHLGPTSTWDTAAGHALVNNMGCKVMNLKGEELKYSMNYFENPAFIVMNEKAYKIMKSLNYIK